jgi:glycerol-3-phosphate acyltransferase PlsY
VILPDLTSGPAVLLAVAAAAYGLGSIPFGMVWARVFGLGDLRAIGSGNIGATNVLRTGSKPAALLTLVCDAGKAGATVLAARALAGEDAAQVAGLASFAGHCFPIWLGFKGGKGVATYLGTLLALAFPLGLAACAIWAAVAAASRISSLSALTAAALVPLLAPLLAPGSMALLIALALLILSRHAPNISRLVAGTEPRFGRKP